MAYSIIVRRGCALKHSTKCVRAAFCLFPRPYSNVNERLENVVRQIGRRDPSNLLKLAPNSQEYIAKLLEQYPRSIGNNAEIILTETAPLSAEAFDTLSNEQCAPKRFVPNTLANENPFKEVREKLPIFSYRQEILKLINENQVIILSGSTGMYKFNKPDLLSPMNLI